MHLQRLGPETNFVEALRDHPGLGRFGATYELEHLPTVLVPGEFLEDILQGRYAEQIGVLVRTTSRVIFLAKGIASVTVEDFALDKITSVQYSIGFLTGEIKLFASGNSAAITQTLSRHTQAFADGIRAAVREASSSSGPSTLEAVDALERLASLKERGLLSQAEFEDAKRRALGQRGLRQASPPPHVDAGKSPAYERSPLDELNDAVEAHCLNGYTIRSRDNRVAWVERVGHPIRSLWLSDDGVLWYRDGHSSPLRYGEMLTSGDSVRETAQLRSTEGEGPQGEAVVASEQSTILGEVGATTPLATSPIAKAYRAIGLGCGALVALLAIAVGGAVLFGPGGPIRSREQIKADEQARVLSFDKRIQEQASRDTAVPSPPRQPVTANPRSQSKAVQFCRSRALPLLKHDFTVEWLDSAKQESADTWLVSGIRTARGRGENVDQLFTCRVQVVNGQATLRLLQLFGESTRSGNDVYESY